mgnify:FL=1
MVKIRRSAVAGLFYESDPNELREQIRRAFLHKLGPGKLPPPPPPFSGRVLGVVVPHAGYMYSGHVAAHGYFRLAEAGTPEVVFLLGPNHHGLGDPIAASAAEYWETPLGRVKVDLDIGEELAKKSGIVTLEDLAHLHEHSLEVQLPFLQYIFGDEISIVPVSMMIQYPEASRILGYAIADIIKERGLKAYIVASSDFTHYEPAEVASRKDKKAIDRILALDYKGLYDVVEETPVSMCGPGPVMALLAAAERLGAKRAKLLKYANSGDVTGDYSSVVGYASILVGW